MRKITAPVRYMSENDIVVFNAFGKTNGLGEIQNFCGSKVQKHTIVQFSLFVCLFVCLLLFCFVLLTKSD